MIGISSSDAEKFPIKTHSIHIMKGEYDVAVEKLDSDNERPPKGDECG